MSHYTVLVIGDDIETQLEPYNENAEVAPYIDGSPEATADTLTRALKYYQELEDAPRFVGHTVDTLTKAEKLELLDAYDGGEYREDDGGNLIRYSTYNPLSKWDWYEEGGRWSGFFFVKPGTPESEYVLSKVHWSEQYQGEDSVEKDVVGTVKAPGLTDSALKKHIDFELMRKDAEIKALQDFEAFEEATKGLTSPGSWRTFARGVVGPWFDLDDLSSLTDEERVTFRAKVDEARELFNKFEFTQAARKLHYWGDAHDIFCLDDPDPKKAYVERAIKHRVTTYAVLKDGEWFARGEMGWFGLSTETLSDDEWSTKVAELIDSLPEDTRLTLVDVHI